MTADWTVPVASCGSVSSNADFYSSTWTGIDGGVSGNNTVEQDGTEADCFGGTPQYDAWYELYGASTDNNTLVKNGDEVQLPNPVLPGNVIEASVSESGTSTQTWTFNLIDLPSYGSSSPNWTFSVAIPVTVSDYGGGNLPAMSTAEWIAERPEVNGSVASLAPYGSVTLTGVTANVSETLQSLSPTPIEMFSLGGAVLSVPGPLESSGTFGTTWYATG